MAAERSPNGQAKVLQISDAQMAAAFLCRAEDWLQDVDPLLACRVARLRATTLTLVEKLQGPWRR